MLSVYSQLFPLDGPLTLCQTQPPFTQHTNPLSVLSADHSHSLHLTPALLCCPLYRTLHLLSSASPLFSVLIAFGYLFFFFCDFRVKKQKPMFITVPPYIVLRLGWRCLTLLSCFGLSSRLALCRCTPTTPTLKIIGYSRRHTNALSFACFPYLSTFHFSPLLLVFISFPRFSSGVIRFRLFVLTYEPPLSSVYNPSEHLSSDRMRAYTYARTMNSWVRQGAEKKPLFEIGLRLGWVLVRGL